MVIKDIIISIVVLCILPAYGQNDTFIYKFKEEYNQELVDQIERNLANLQTDSLKKVLEDSFVGLMINDMKRTKGSSQHKNIMDYYGISGLLSYWYLKTHERDAVDQYHVASILSTLKYYREAIVEYSNSLRDNDIYPSKDILYGERGICKLELEDYYGAIEDFNNSIELDNSNVSYIMGRGRSFAILSQFPNAINDFSQVLEIDPDKGAAYYYRGLCKHSLGQKKNGCLDLSRAGELGRLEAYEQIKTLCTP